MTMLRLFLCIIVVICFIPNDSLSNEECSSAWDEILSYTQIDQEYDVLLYKCGEDLKEALRIIISTNVYFSYKESRQEMFSNLDNISGEVCGVYTGKCVLTNSIPNPNEMNCEHSWPQSLGATGIAKSDLHHLFPSDSRMNSRRSNHPFCEVTEIQYDGGESFLGRSKFGTLCFEPPDNHKGDLARSMFYFSVRYNFKIDKEQEYYFKRWIELDPISEKEIIRNDEIEHFQQNRNLFIDHNFLIPLIDDF